MAHCPSSGPERKKSGLPARFDSKNPDAVAGSIEAALRDSQGW